MKKIVNEIEWRGIALSYYPLPNYAIDTLAFPHIFDMYMT